MTIFSDNYSPGLFYMIPSGKPLASEPRDSEGTDTRRRIYQKGNPAHLCFYYACNLVRERYGKGCDEGVFAEKRKIERIGSEWRKALSLDWAHLLSMGVQPFTYDFMSQLAKVTASTHRLFAERLGYDIEELSQQILERFKSQIAKLGHEQLMAWEPSYFYHIAACYLYAKSEGLIPSAWNPSQSFEEFKSCLHEKGPMVVAGRFGVTFYSMPPF